MADPTVPSYTEEDVDLAWAAFQDAYALAASQEPRWDLSHDEEQDLHLRIALRAALLAVAGRLVPPGSEMERRKVVKVWYRSLQADGSVWCETSNQRECVELSQGVADRFEQLAISEVTSAWSPWSPSVPDTKERDDA